jgi:tetratricopeptide (TPR) repeat protein
VIQYYCMRRPLLVCLMVLFVTAPGFSAWAQLNKREMRKFKKAKARFETFRYEEAESMLRPLCARHPSYPDTWNLLAQTQVMIYYRKGQAYPEYTLAEPDSIAKADPVRDSLTRIFIRQMNDQMPARVYLRQAVDTWREATLRCETAEWPSRLLRNFLLEPTMYDSTNNPNAIAEFKEAEAAFEAHNYGEAIRHYRIVTSLDPHYYHAWLYLGDSYLQKKEYREAAGAFRELIRLYPERIEPRKYLAESLADIEDYTGAQNVLINALILYPDAELFSRLSQVAIAQNKHFSRHWTERVVFPNTVGDQPLNEKGDRTWMEYINGFSLIEPFCNKAGIIVKKNERTSTLYAEVFSWEYMLRKSAPEAFPFARRMQQAGYLDCYALFSEYHVDFREQYAHFARNNKEKLKSYIEMLMNN